MIPSIIAAVTWIIQNPAIIIKGEQFVAGLISDTIGTWNRFKSGELTQAQLQAEWDAAGLDYAAISAEADKRGL
jgi:hypothetical protein